MNNSKNTNQKNTGSINGIKNSSLHIQLDRVAFALRSVFPWP